jgi:beta-xylosidase
MVMVRTAVSIISASLVAGAWLASSALAAEYMGSGTVTYVPASTAVTQLAGGRSLIKSHIKGVILSNDTANPIHLSAQDCDGATILAADGKQIAASGSCHAVDTDGDVWTLWYHNSAAGNNWGVIGGTGKYDGMTGGGTTSPLADLPDGRFVISWDGAWQMK